MDSNTRQSGQKNKNKKLVILVSGFGLIIAAVFAFLKYNSIQQEKAKRIAADKKYVHAMHQFVSDGYKAGTKAEEMVKTLQDVWHDAIFEATYEIDGKIHASGMDFNDAIQAQYTSFEKNGDLSKLESHQAALEADMEKLKNPPAKYKDIYQDIVDAYGSLKEFTEMADDPSGSLESLTDKANELDSEVAKKLNAVDVQLPEEK
ncbi:MAG: hypothetical protein HLX43_16125 [Bacillus sp. (in: Bacteria)]|nr:hypothetical protein [Bacillus sp. (in: firmicutes)]